MRRARQRGADQALETESVERGPAAEPRAASLMELQRTAGNKAVGSLLARDADKGDTSEKGTSTTLVMPDPIGALPVESYSMAGPDEIAVVVPSSGADPVIFQAAANGTYFAVVKLSNAGIEITLTEVVISSVQIGSGHLSFRLNAAKTQVDRPQEPKGKVD